MATQIRKNLTNGEIAAALAAWAEGITKGRKMNNQSEIFMSNTRGKIQEIIVEKDKQVKL